MRVAVSWLRELVPGLSASAQEIAAALVASGLEVEQVLRFGEDVQGVVTGRVLDVEELTEFKKPIRFCHVDVGEAVHDVVCGATNFSAGDVVAFARPGAVLPGGFAIASRQTYGRTSDGMICSARELGISDEHDGILVLPADTPLGLDVVEHLVLRDEVLDIAVTPDRGYVLSMRGMARETATAFSLPFSDPGVGDAVGAAQGGYEVRLDDLDGCDRYVARIVTGLDPQATSPLWLQRRLSLAGMRAISLPVDVTNYVQLLLGQPLHAFDLAALHGPVVVRRAHPGEALTTLDSAERALDPEDLVIADDSGPIALAGVMGGAATQVHAGTTDLLLESAHFLPLPIARTARRHKLPSEASKRYERGVDPALAPVAADLACHLLSALGGAVLAANTDVGRTVEATPIALPLDLPGRVAGRPYAEEVVRGRLRDVGCEVSDGPGSDLLVRPPSWRHDLTGRAELVEEVVRLEGYDTIPVRLPVAVAGRGLLPEQRAVRTSSRALAAAGFVEVVCPPFVGEQAVALFGAGAQPPALVNPLAETEAWLRPSLQPGLLAALVRNVGRGLADVALFETGLVFRSPGSATATAPGVEERPSAEDLAVLDAALPRQVRHVALALSGSRHGRPADWADAVEAVQQLGRALGVDLQVRPAQQDPWHPGRCAAVLLDGKPVGFAGELHPRVTSALELPARSVTAEVDLDALLRAATSRGPVPAPTVSPYPPSAVDVALVVDAAVPAAEVEGALRWGAGPLLETLRLFDVFEGPQVGAGRRSLAYSLRFRAPDRTLTDAEVLAARDAAVASAGDAVGAVLRGPA